MKCCICGKEIKGYGNNPDGYIDPKTLKAKEWKPEDRCCDDCNMDKVVAGRIMLMKAKSTVDRLDFDTVEEGIDQLRSLLTNDDITKIEYDFILANWDNLIK